MTITNNTDASAESADLLARWRAQGDPESFRQLVARHGAMVQAVCRRSLGDGADADDAVQATFIILARRGGGIRDASRLGPWLHACAVRVCAHARRSARRRARHESAAPAPAPAGPEPDWDEVRPHLDAAIEALSAAQRAAVVGFYLEGRPQAELASEHGCSVAAVKMRLQAGLARLRELLQRRGVAVSSAVIASGLASEAQAGTSLSAVAATPSASAQQLAGAYLAVGARQARWWLGCAAALALGGGAWLAWPAAPTEAPAPRAVPADPPAPAARPDDPWLRPDPDHGFAGGITAELRELALRGKPFSLLRDPAAGPALARADAELARWMELGRRAYDAPPLLALLRSAEGLSIQAAAIPGASAMEIPFLLGIAGGAAQAELAAYRWRGAADTRIGGQAAWEQNGFAASAVAGRWFLGRKDELAARLGRNHDEVPRAPDAPLWFRFRAAGAPAGTAPAILLTSTPAADGFISRLILADRGLAPPLRGLTSLAALRGWQDLPWRPARAGRLLSTGPHDIVLAPSLDADAAIVSEGLAELGRRSGLPLVELVDGDVLVEADWHQGPIPSFRAIVGLRSAADASRLLAACAQAQGWAVDGAGYAIASPVGLISLRQDGDRLLLASTVELLDAKPRDEALPAGCSLRLSLDLPSLGRAWLPLAMDLLGRQRRRLEPGPWFWLSSLAAQGSLQTDDLRGGKPFDIYTWNGKSTIQVAALAHIFGRDNLPAQVNRGMAGYIRRTGQGTTELAIVLRSAEGFVCYASDDERWQDQGRLPGAPGAPVRMRGGKTEADWDWQAERAAHSFTRADLDQRLAGWAHLAGPGLDALPVVEIPAPVIFDRSWLPPVDAVIRNLPSRHELLLKPVTGGVVIDEEGLPLLPLLTAGQWFIHY